MALWALQPLQGLYSAAGMEGGRGKPVVEGRGGTYGGGVVTSEKRDPHTQSR